MTILRRIAYEVLCFVGFVSLLLTSIPVALAAWAYGEKQVGTWPVARVIDWLVNHKPWSEKERG